MTPELLFKVLGENGKPYHGGFGAWDLPKDGQPGAWREVTGKLVPCQSGLHLCRTSDLVYWLGPTIYEAEHVGERINVDASDPAGDPKVVVRKARLLRHLDTWNERTARLFAADCAEHVLPIFERHYPNDSRPRDAINVARRFANGEATRSELAAAWAAAWDAARDAARAAAWDAARDAARDAERQWQTQRLMNVLGIAAGTVSTDA